MTSKISRRAFLKGSLTAAGSVAAGTTLIKAARAAARGEGEPLVTVIDISRCIGCEECVYGCQQANADKFPEPEKPFPKMFPARAKVADWSDRREVSDRLTPYNWLYIQHAVVTIDGEETELNIPRRCMHCENPPCVKLCPFGAAQQEENGLSRIDSDICFGGAKCKTVCPWHIPERQTGVGMYLNVMPNFAGNGVMYKCDRCYTRIAQGDIPMCIEICPENVQIIGPRSEMLEKAHARAKEMNGYLYGEHENGGTNTIYISPVPFDELNKSIEKGMGRPHFNKVENTMAQGTNIAKAMAIAPVAGIAAAAGKFYLSSKEDR